MTNTVSLAGIDPGLEPFVPLFPPADLSDPVTVRKQLAGLSAAAAPPDTTGMEIEDHAVPADPDVAVRIYRPHRPLGAAVSQRQISDLGAVLRRALAR